MTAGHPAKAAAFVSTLLLAAGIAGVPQVRAETHQVCETMWESAPAASHCTRHTIYWTGANPGSSNGCQLVAVCNVDVTIGGANRTFAKNVGAQVTAGDMGRLALCFRKWSDPLAIDGWGLFLRLGCSAGDIDVATAVAEGLPD